MLLIFFFALVCFHFCFFCPVFCVFQLFREGVRLTYIKTHLFSCISESAVSRTLKQCCLRTQFFCFEGSPRNHALKTSSVCVHPPSQVTLSCSVQLVAFSRMLVCSLSPNRAHLWAVLLRTAVLLCVVPCPTISAGYVTEYICAAPHVILCCLFVSSRTL